mmetsp:Transcript_5602/g.17707  ORF Transcript_5602/g.17707 Transcript_5602/m.17707 type:complete len:227 (-) Transcript_5602:1593-2273(-)
MLAFYRHREIILVEVAKNGAKDDGAFGAGFVPGLEEAVGAVVVEGGEGGAVGVVEGRRRQQVVAVLLEERARRGNGGEEAGVVEAEEDAVGHVVRPEGAREVVRGLGGAGAGVEEEGRGVADALRGSVGAAALALGRKRRDGTARSGAGAAAEERGAYGLQQPRDGRRRSQGLLGGGRDGDAPRVLVRQRPQRRGGAREGGRPTPGRHRQRRRGKGLAPSPRRRRR